MKLIIQIPCYNEENSLPITLKELPREIEGFDKVEWLIIDDGSVDKTAQIAKELGVDHVVKHGKNKGLAAAFMTGLNECIKLKADVIVNTDADNQYNANCIKKLIAPIIEQGADIVVGTRPIININHFSLFKKILQKIGSFVVRKASETTVEDAPSGFRAFTKDAAMKLNVFDKYTYTLETIIQAGKKNMSIISVPIEVNSDLRPSRLVKNTLSYVKRSANTICRMFIVYKPFRFFTSIGMLFFILGFIISLRYLYFYISGNGIGHIQSLILASILIGIGVQTIIVAFVADLLAINRMLSEDIQYRIKKLELKE